jgi:hypothetical protein
MCCRNAKGIAVVFDCSSLDGFNHIGFWINEARKIESDAFMILVGNAACLEKDRVVSAEEGAQIAANYGIEYIEVSTRTGSGVHELYSRLASGCVRTSLRLLWRGSRDGFRANDFHQRCDGCAPTLTLISDLNGNIFGGFTPVAWESRSFGKSKGDDTGRSYIFTLKNPHNVPAKKFSLICDRKSSAIRISSRFGPCFGKNDIVISDCCNTEPSHTSDFGGTYENKSGIEGKLFFTGSDTFRVKDIEVFELPDC